MFHFVPWRHEPTAQDTFLGDRVVLVEFVVVLAAVLVLVAQRVLARRRPPVRVLPLLVPACRAPKVRPKVGSLLPGPRADVDVEQPQVAGRP